MRWDCATHKNWKRVLPQRLGTEMSRRRNPRGTVYKRSQHLSLRYLCLGNGRRTVDVERISCDRT